ncbi:nuclear transport factor 2 family protein [Lewinella sp. IMCC34191]|uniref:nuclear transport factor 2 family protein n=1 Tax=Lewinella sp. IMCC34191 TaxID=2259172 RepID=UPI000E23A881|nr:nuclear transport factor 2 family protein [Lewinella sp. IMCC34191]
MDSVNCITTFYTAFARGDSAGMIACYHPDVTFRDPVFGELHGPEARGMWEMLLSGKSAELQVDFANVQSDADTGSADWTARYHFGKDRRPVVNEVHARFRFRDGLIYEHTDSFSSYRWARQALGPVGWLLGWTPFLRAKVRATARQKLTDYLSTCAPAP